MFKSFSIKTKLILALSLILVLAFLAIGLLNYNASRKSLWRNIREEALPGISNEIYNEIQKDMMMPLQVASTMASDSFLKDWVLNGEKNVKKIKKYLWEIKQKNDFFSTFLISDRTKKYYHFNGILKTVSRKDEHDDWYFRFVESGQEYDLDVDTNQAEKGAITVFINYRLNDYQGNLIGVTGVGLKRDAIGRRLNRYQKRYGKIIYLVDEKGKIRVHSSQKLIGKRNIQDRKGMAKVAEDLMSKSSSQVIKEYQRDGEKRVVLAKFMPELDWFLLVEHRAGEAIQKIQNRFVRNMIIGFIVTILVIVIYVFLVNHYQGRLEELANKDGLTELANRRHFLDLAEDQLSEAVDSGEPFSILMIDIDKFKNVNDSYGHSTGDGLLRDTAELLSKGLRDKDLIGRIGGDEFAVALPEAPEKEAAEVAERLRAMVEKAGDSLGPNSYSATISVGVSTIRRGEHDSDLEELLKEADKALYRAKDEGRNSVFLWGGEDTAGFS